MAGQSLGSRAIIGSFYKALEQNVGATWVGQVSMLFNSDQESETYKWLGQSPVMREWIGERMAKGLTEQGITVINKLWEATLEIPVPWMDRDKSGQIQVRINELARRANAHWAKLLSLYIDAGTGNTYGNCYDGQYFFDTDHSEGSSGSQSNDLYIDISGLPVTAHGSPTAPSVSEAQNCIMQAVSAILGFKDNQGEPMNEEARNFLVMVPTALWTAMRAAVAAPVIDGGDTNPIAVMDGYRIEVAVNPRLTWTDSFSVFRADGDVAAMIRQEEKGVKVAAVAENSELEFRNNVHQYGLSASRNVGYGYWQKACYVQMY